MKRHLVLPVVAAATAGLLLTSCSSGDSEPDDDIAGVQSPSPSEDDEGSEESEDADAEADTDAPDDGIDRPEIDVPDDLEKEFEPVDTDDPDELAVLADQEQYIWAVDEAITSGSADRPALAFYSDGEGFINSIEFVSRFHDEGYSISGKVEYYNRSVTLRDEGVATSSYCADFREAFMVDIESGEKYPEDSEQFLYASRLERTEDGVWQTASFSVESGGSDCR
ncbi:hypothetical protein [Streptomyces bohaiensis]|uniref:Lipoprotein n=1 Tax=Streptomyces bohaiensis TaxID=1431344 RepID=A0ABX1C5F1_9ACTN|nr:hypothetical protein [Streptomyces bohaiensis]NJQ14444.1 hypothetical protein [Streptomyces bohaiensis]